MTEYEKLLLEEVRTLRKENGEEFGEVKDKLGDVQTAVARLDQKLIDHCSDTGKHPAVARRPCDELKRHLARHWAVFLILLTALAAELVAAVVLFVKIAHKGTP